MSSQGQPKYNHRYIKQIQEYYDAYLGSEPGKRGSLEEFWSRYKLILSFLDSISEDDTKILDVGCGTGMAAEKLRRFGHVYGMDISAKSVMEARSRLDGVCVSMAQELPFRDNVFDVAVCTEVLEHLLKPVKALTEFNRVLKARGYLVISTPNPWYWEITVNRVVTTLRRQKAGTGQIIENYISPEKLRGMLKKTRFEVEAFKTVFFKPDFIWGFLRKIPASFGLYQVYLARNVDKGVNDGTERAI